MPFGEPTDGGDDGKQDRHARRIARRALRKRFERHDDQGVSGQHRDRRAELDVDRRLAAPKSRVVEARQIVVNERGAMQQLDRGRGGVGRRRIAVAAGLSDGEAKLRADAVTARKDRITYRGCEEGRGACALGARDNPMQRLLDAFRSLHDRSLHLSHSLVTITCKI